MPKSGTIIGISSEFLSYILGIPDDVEAFFSYNSDKEVVTIKFRSFESKSFIFLGERIHLYLVPESAEYTYTHIWNKNSSISMMRFYSQMEVAKEVNSINE